MAPVKGLRLVSVEAVELDRAGIRGDRRFYLVDEDGALVNAKRAPRLLTVRAEVEGTSLVLRDPDGSVVEGDVELAEHVETSFYGRPVPGRVVEGPWGDMLSSVAGRQLRLVRTEREGDGHDRGPAAGASLVSTASLDALADVGGVSGRVDGRRFRMTIGVDGVGPHEEDGWLDRRVQVGGATVLVRGNTGRCAVTTLDPDRGVSDFDTLGAISAYRGDTPTSERLPFGVWCEVVVPGPVAVGDSVESAPG